MNTLTVRELIKGLLAFDMDDEVHIEIESERGIAHQKSEILELVHDNYSVRIVTRGYLIDRDSDEYVVGERK